jgi:hypothetical protein
MLDSYRPGYIRVSTKEQELGLKSQMQQLIDYGVRKEDIFVDRGVSGTSNSHSEKMDALMLAVQADRAKHNRKIEVVVAKLDRWGRDPEETIALLKELHVSGACLTSLGENIHMVNPDSGTRMLIVQIMLAVLRRRSVIASLSEPGTLLSLFVPVAFRSNPRRSSRVTMSPGYERSTRATVGVLSASPRRYRKSAMLK